MFKTMRKSTNVKAKQEINTWAIIRITVTTLIFGRDRFSEASENLRK